jgi:SAM-dependent methyltransferase
MTDILDVGCGTSKRSGATGIDMNPRCGADVVHDLNVFPWPLDDDSFDEVYADNVMEHLEDVVRAMEEIHRVSRPGALVKIVVPYFRSRWAAIDPTHRHPFTVDSFAYFDPADPIHDRYRYSEATFAIERMVFNETIKMRPLKRSIKRYADRHPRRYESHFSQLWPLDDLTFYLRVLK